MIAVGIDISKSRSTVAILGSNGDVIKSPYVLLHNHADIDALIKELRAMEGPVKIAMENTGHYHYPVLDKLYHNGFEVHVINPFLMKKYGEAALHKNKTDPKDALLIARFILEKSYMLQPYGETEQKYSDLRFLARQYDQRIRNFATNKVLLQCLLDETMPGITNILPVPQHYGERNIFVQFIKKFKSYDNILRMGKSRFLKSYDSTIKKCVQHGGSSKGLVIYETAKEKITTRGDNAYMVMAQNQYLDILIEMQNAADELIGQMRVIAETIPEYRILRSMNGVGSKLGPLILAEIGDIRRFKSGKALNAYAGNDAPAFQSGEFESHNRHISKHGNAALRKYCFEVMKSLKTSKPAQDPVYLFMVKKEQEGKPYNVAKMAGVNKFLRIYYARAMEMYR